jgi:hypothetical protein
MVRTPAKMLFLVCFESGEWPASTSGISIRRVPATVRLWIDIARLFLARNFLVVGRDQLGPHNKPVGSGIHKMERIAREQDKNVFSRGSQYANFGLTTSSVVILLDYVVNVIMSP